MYVWTSFTRDFVKDFMIVESEGCRTVLEEVLKAEQAQSGSVRMHGPEIVVILLMIYILHYLKDP